MTKLTFTLNGDQVETWIESHEMLIDILRKNFNLLGAREGCGMGECGACTVIVSEKSVNSCLFPALEVEGQIVETVEGLAEAGKFHPLQQAFLDNGASQCGFCTPGMLMSAKAFLDECKTNPEIITDAEIKQVMAGNLCRCTGYFQIIDAVKAALKEQQ